MSDDSEFIPEDDDDFYIPEGDEEFLAWLDNFIANLKLLPQLGVSEAEMKVLEASREDFYNKMVIANQAESHAKQAMLELKRAFEAYPMNGGETLH